LGDNIEFATMLSKVDMGMVADLLTIGNFVDVAWPEATTLQRQLV
jgi:hypothetical protein